MSQYVNISHMIGKTITNIQKGNDFINFIVDDGSMYEMYHSQDCCEDVSIEDIIGDLDDLIGSPILTASEDRSNEDPIDKKNDSKYRESFTWTFYNISTFKVHVTVRWLGESNGHYSESVDVYYTEAKLKEHDIVLALDGISNIPKDTAGTVVYIYNDDVEVEFILPDESSVVETINKKFIKKKV